MFAESAKLSCDPWGQFAQAAVTRTIAALSQPGAAVLAEKNTAWLFLGKLSRFNLVCMVPATATRLKNRCCAPADRDNPPQKLAAEYDLPQ